MAHQFTYTRRIEFADTDMAGLMHFANFFRFMESAEHAMWRALGRTVHEQTDNGAISFVRVHAECDYLQPLRFEEQVDIRLTVREVRTRAIVYDFAFKKPDDDKEAARGSMTVVCVRKHEHPPRITALEIPADLRALLTAGPSPAES